MPRVTQGSWRLAAMALAVALVSSACLGEAAPSPTAEPTIQPQLTPTPSPSPTRAPARRDETLVVMAPEHPTRLLPPARNATERLLIDVLYDPLYRLDEQLRPVPELARTLPEVSEDGRTWRIPIKADARFHDGKKVTAGDVLFSLKLAASPSCPLGLELCNTVRNYMAENPERNDNLVTISLTEPYAPFLTEALGRLPILSEAAVQAATDDLVEAAGRLNQERPDRVILEIWEQTNRLECADAEPPAGCRLAEHRGTLEQVFRRARLGLPSDAPYIDSTGIFDEDAYLGDLLERLGSLAQVLDSSAEDKQSAALGLLDATARPFGGGPYRLVSVEDDGTWILEANQNHTRRQPIIPRLEVRIEPDPSVATTRLLSGEADWVLESGRSQEAVIDGTSGFSAAARPTDTQYGILFNVRPDRVYFDQVARRAFALCLDHDGLATSLDPGRHVALTPYTATSWALPETVGRERDVAAATALLDGAGWLPAADGVRTKGETRLSTSIAVRPTSIDVWSFANEAAEQLTECGIELRVEELDLTGDTMLDQLLWPNDFDTLLWVRTLGPDPDTAVRVFESSRITSEDNRADENPSGFMSELADHLIASARGSLDEAERTAAYAGVQRLLEDGVPYWPLWYDSAVSAISERVRGPEGPVDPARSRYDWDISSWELVDPVGA